MNKATSLVTVLAVAALALSACNTMEGLGQDVKAGGEAVSTSAAETKEKLKEE